MLVDTHIHLNHSALAPVEKTIQDAKLENVHHFIVPGTDYSSWPQIQTLAKYNEVSIALGLHPLFLDDLSKNHIDMLSDLHKQTPLVAIGEIGLDYYDKPSANEKNRQKAIFEEQIKVAEKLNLPVLLHIRKAHQDVLTILKTMHFSNGGMAHAFSGSLEEAKELVKLGFKIGLGGGITYPGRTKIESIITALDTKDFVLETDAPDQPLYEQKYPNHPKHLRSVFHHFIKLTSETRPPDEIEQQFFENVKEVLGRIV